jgi:hypothetical protein
MLREAGAYPLRVLEEFIGTVLNARLLRTNISGRAVRSQEGQMESYLICAQCFTGEVLGTCVETSLYHPRVELHKILHLSSGQRRSSDGFVISEWSKQICRPDQPQ